MIIARIYYPVTTLGYGKRVGIWVSGCERNCKNCMSESLKSFETGVSISVEDICKSLERIQMPIDGFTISGGEPFLQMEELADLVEKLAEKYTKDIIIYTGYTLAQLEKKNASLWTQMKENIAVLIDGEYMDALNDGVGARGSSNQCIHIFRMCERHAALATQQRSVQLIEHTKGMTIIGIP